MLNKRVMAKRYWLMKSEPAVFSFDDLAKAPRRTTHWDGIRNYQARNFMRDEIKKGDRVLYYHSNSDEAGCYGVAEVVREGYPEKEEPWVMVDIKAIQRFKSPVTRMRMARDERLADMMVMKKGSRLSIQPVTAKEFAVVCELGEPVTIR